MGIVPATRLVSFGALALVLVACRGSPTGPPVDGPPTDDEIPIYGACEVQPNYLGQVILNRWPEFPLAFFLDDGSFPLEFRADYRAAITDGIGRWDAATPNDLGAVVEVEEPASADFVVDYRAFTPVIVNARTIHAAGNPFLTGGEITFNATAMAEGEDLFRDGTLSREGFLRVISGIAAHEMGHLLGIIGHSTRVDVIMGPAFIDAPTILHVNTLMHAYCRA